VADPPVHEAAPPDPVEETVLALTRVWSDVRLYPVTHPVIAERLAEAQTLLESALDGRPALTIKNVDGDLVYGARRLFRSRPRPAGLIAALNRLSIGCVTLTRGATAEELSSLCRALAEDSGDLSDSAAVRRYLEEHAAQHVEVDGLMLRPDDEPAEQLPVMQLYDSTMDVARQVMQSARLGQRMDVAGAQSVTSKMVAEMTQHPSTALGLASLRGHDEYTFAHSVHAALLCLAFGDFLGMNEEELTHLGTAAMLHDVGKAAVPIEVLRKPAKLSEVEWDQMTRHPWQGALMLLEYENLPPIVPLVAFEHHIGCSYSGYPKVAHRRELSLPSLIVSLADVYDALTTHRPYRPPLSPDQAVAEIMKMADTQLDPRLVGWFRDMLGVYPPGTCVVLSSGELAVVCQTNHDQPERPEVVIVTDAAGAPLQRPSDADLAATGDGRPGRTIVRAVPAVEAGLDPFQVMAAWVERHHLPAKT
jgi:HD-GYP domain-containing protein (c-di-GMP phosphodiesterase class II)